MATNAKVLLAVDDDPEFARSLAAWCTELGLLVECCADGLQAMMALTRNPPDLMILDLKAPGADGLKICEKLAADRQLGSIPVVILGDGTDEQTLRRCRKHGAYYVPKGPDTWERLRPIVCRLSKIEDRAARAIEPSASDPTTNAAESEEAGLPKVLLIEDDPDYSRALQIKLRAYGIEVLRAFNGTHGVQMAWEKTPDLIITDYTMPEGYGNYVLRRLKDDRSTMDIPVIVLTGRRIMGQADHALERDLANLGAVRYFTKPVAFEELLAEIRKHIEIPSEPCQTVA